VLKAHGHAMPGADTKFGDAHLTGPSADTRVWVADVDGDGKLDLLVGDQIVLMHCAKGVSEADAAKKYAAWLEKQQALFKAQTTTTEVDEKTGEKSVALKASDDFNERYQALEKERDTFVKQESTGFVWLMRGK
jgi:hypothetical protein